MITDRYEKLSVYDFYYTRYNPVGKIGKKETV